MEQLGRCCEGINSDLMIQRDRWEWKKGQSCNSGYFPVHTRSPTDFAVLGVCGDGEVGRGGPWEGGGGGAGQVLSVCVSACVCHNVCVFGREGVL